MGINIPELTQMVVRAAAQATIVAEDFDRKATCARILDSEKAITVAPGAARNLAMTLRAMAETTTSILQTVTRLERDNITLTTLAVQQSEMLAKIERMTLAELWFFWRAGKKLAADTAQPSSIRKP